MQTEMMKVSGMTCGGCITKVTRALNAVAGVGDVHVSLTPGEATVRYDENLTSLDTLKAAVKSAGYSADPSTAESVPRKSGGCCGGSAH